MHSKTMTGGYTMKEKNIQELAIRMGLITVEDMCQYTIAQLVVKIANKVNELVNEVWRFETDVQEILKTQNENIQYLLGEGLHLEVENIFDGWLQDGTFDTLINQTALEKVNERIDETNAQLSELANKGTTIEVLERVTKEEIERQITDGTITALTIEDKSIEPIKTTFINSKNKFNKNKVVDGKYISYIDGTTLVNPTYSMSQPIKVKYGQKIFRYPSNQHFACFDALGKFVPYPNAPYVGSIVTIPAGATSIVFSFKTEDLDKAMVVESDKVIDGYIAYEEKIDVSLLPDLLEENEFELNLPSKLYGVVGNKVQIYFENLKSKSQNYDIKVECSKGIQFSKRWFMTSDAVELLPLKVKFFKNNVLISEKSTNITVCSDTNKTTTEKCLFIGDSTTNHGVYTQALLDKFSTDTMKIELLGTRGMHPNSHEGRSGWSALQYVSSASLSGVTNAFWDGSKFNFTYYMNQNSYTNVDYVFIHLGINDIFNIMSDDDADIELPNILNRFKVMINSIKAFDTNIKIGIISTIPCNNDQDAFGSAYGCNKQQWQYKRIYDKWLNYLIKEFENKEQDNIYLIPCHVAIDSENGFRDAVHPTDTEYQTNMMQPIYNFIKNN